MGKSVTIDYKTLRSLTPASFEYLKFYVNYASELNRTELYEYFAKKTKFSENYASEIHSKLKPLLREFLKQKLDVEFIRIPIESIARFYNRKLSKSKEENEYK